MAYIDCDKCSRGVTCTYRFQYDNRIVQCSRLEIKDAGANMRSDTVIVRSLTKNATKETNV